MKKINLDGWKQFSNREYSKSFKNSDNTVMIKATQSSDKSQIEAIKREYLIAESVNSLGFPTPQVGDMVELEDGSVGIIYENIEDKISLSRAVAREPEKLDYYMQKFATLAKKMHSIDAPKEVLPSFKERITAGLKNATIFTDDEKKIILEKIKNLPDGNKCLHGDFTPSNGITSPKGDYIIDLGFMSYGDPLFDVGSFYSMTTDADEALVEQIFHMSKDMAYECWKSFAKHYFESDDIESIIEKIKPYAMFSTMAVLTLVPDAMTVKAHKDELLA